MNTHGLLIAGLLLLSVNTADGEDLGPPIEGIERDVQRLERAPSRPTGPSTNQIRRQLDHADTDNATRNEINRRLRRLDTPTPTRRASPSRQPLSRPSLF